MKSSRMLCHTCAGFFLATILLFSSAASGKNSSLDSLLDDIKEKSGALSALSCNFTQKRSLALFSKPIEFQGRLFLIRPEKLRWEFLAPVPSVLIFNGDKGMRCNKDSAPEKFVLARDPVMRMVAEQLWTWLDGDYSKLHDKYQIEKTGDSAIQVKPKNSSSEFIQDISIVFDKVTRQPESVTIKETGGDETSISFFSYQLSPSIPDSTFTQCFPLE